MAVMGGTIRTSAQVRDSSAPTMNVSPERYIAPRKRAWSGGTANGSTLVARAGKKKPHTPTDSARRPTAAKYARSHALTGFMASLERRSGDDTGAPNPPRPRTRRPTVRSSAGRRRCCDVAANDPFRASVYCDTEKQRDLAVKVLSEVNPNEVQVFDEAVEGWVRPDQLAALTRAGLLVDAVAEPEIAPAAPAAAARSRSRRATPPAAAGPHGRQGEDVPGRPRKAGKAGKAGKARKSRRS